MQTEAVHFAAPPLLEREVELSQLRRHVEAARDGRGAAVAVIGPAGIGKTSLLAAARALGAQHGLDMLAARGGELEREFAFGVVRNLLEPAVSGPTGRGALDGAARLAAPLLGHAADPQDRADSPFAIVHALYWVCVNLAQRRPLLALVDDLQWADAASLRFFAYLVRRLEELPLVILTAARPAPEDERTELLDAVTAAAEVHKLRPAPLSEAAVATFLNAALGRTAAPDLAHAGWVATGGNPFLCTTLATTIAEQGAPPAADVVEQAARAASSAVVARLGRLPVPARALARAVAVLGADADLRHAARLAELSEREAAPAADALATQGILAVGQPLEFVHPLVRAAVREQIPAAERRRSHARAARIVHAAGGSVDAVATHLLSADAAGDRWAAQRLLAAAGSAMRGGAPETAATYLRRALREPPASADLARVLRELSVAELALGDPDGAAEHLLRARSLVASPEPAAAIAREQAAALSIAGRYDEAVAALDSALAECGERDRELALTLEGQRFLHAAMAPRAPSAAVPRLREPLADPAGRTAGERAYLAALAVNALIFMRRPERLGEWGRRLLAGGITDDLAASGAIWHPVAYALIFADRFGLAEQMVAAGLEQAERRGAAVGAARAYQSRAVLRFRQGQLREALADARIAIEAGSHVGLAGRLVAIAARIEALVEAGAFQDANSTLAEAGLSGELAPEFLATFVLHARGRLRLAQGRHVDAVADFEALARSEHGQPWNPGMLPYRSGLALALLVAGDERRARDIARDELELAWRWGGRRAIGIAQRTLGLIERGPAGLALLRDSASTLDRSGAALEHARSLVEFGAAVRRAGTPAAAREPLAAGMELAHRCGARPLAERAREELIVTGARPRRIVRTGVDALTPSELRVARLAAEGAGNREIAQRLFVTLRTVEVHLTHTYRKLGISSRDQLPDALADG